VVAIRAAAYGARNGSACGEARDVRAFLAFVRLSRLVFLLGGAAGVALGAAVAAYEGFPVRWPAYAGAQALVTAFQLMVHYANDWFDRAGDAAADASRRTPFSGGSGVLASGELPPRTALVAACACAAAGLAVTVWFALAGDVAAGVVGGLIAVLAWCYSAPPARLAARGIGELDTALVVSVLVPAAGYAACAGRLGPTLFVAASAPFVATLAMMLCVELPDAPADRRCGKRTLVVRWGAARAWLAIALLAATALAVAAFVALRLARPWLGLALVPAAGVALRLMWLAGRDRRPDAFAYAGPALSATVTGGLAAAYALAATAR